MKNCRERRISMGKFCQKVNRKIIITFSTKNAVWMCQKRPQNLTVCEYIKECSKRHMSLDEADWHSVIDGKMKTGWWRNEKYACLLMQVNFWIIATQQRLFQTHTQVCKIWTGMHGWLNLPIPLLLSHCTHTSPQPWAATGPLNQS